MNQPKNNSSFLVAVTIGAVVSVSVFGVFMRAHAELYNASTELGHYATLPFQPTGWPDFGGDGWTDTEAPNSNVPNAFGLDFPDSTAIDAVHHRLFVADASNFRVLVYQLDSNNNFATGSAEFALGQPDLNSDPDEGGTVNDQELNFPQGLAYDPTTDRLFVSDGNNRILVFDTSAGAIGNNEHAEHVLGQPDMFSSNGVASPTGLWNPVELSIDIPGERLFVVDNRNDRIIVYDVATSTITDGEPAEHELGQIDMNTATTNQTSPTGFSRPLGVLYDPDTQWIFVGDSFNNRVLIFDGASSSLTDNEPAIHILGGTDYNSNFGGVSTSTVNSSTLNTPWGMAFDPTNKRLFVADDRNNRVVSFNVASTTFVDGEAALNEVGQPDFNSKINGASNQDSIWDPEGNIAYDPTSGNLFVPEEANDMVLQYDAKPSDIVNGEPATSEVGQYSYLYPPTGAPIYTDNNFDNSANYSGWRNEIDIIGMADPDDIALDTKNHRMFVADDSDDRVLVYPLDTNNKLTSNLPINVLGQADYRSYGGNPSQRQLDEPYGVAYDPDSERLFVADSESRVVVFDVAPGDITNGERAENLLANVVGSHPYLDIQATTTQNGFSIFNGGRVLYDKTTKRLFVSDINNQRVMVFNAGTSTLSDQENASFVLGQTDFFSTTNASTSQNGMTNPDTMAYDPATQRLFVADANRILVFDVTTSTISNGENASFVLGAPDFFTNVPTTTQSGFNTVDGMAFDSATNQLFVSDNQNSRVMVFNVATSTIANGENASNVIGQPDFVSATCDVTQNNLCNPTGLAIDPTSNVLYISDFGNTRVLEYDLVNITTNSLANATSGSAYSATLSASSNQGALSFGVDPVSTLPTGLSLATSTGVISGTPSVAGSYNFAIDAFDTFSSGIITEAKSFALSVASGGGGGGGGTAMPYLPNAGALTAGTVGTAYSQTFTVIASTTGAITWNLASGALPGGIFLNSTTTAPNTTIAGTPSGSGTFNFSIHVTDTSNDSSTQAYSLVINPAATYSITVTQGSNGTIAPGTQSGIASGASQSFTITPNAGFAISDVTVDGSSVGAVSSYNFTNITANHTITATFTSTGGGGGGGGGGGSVGVASGGGGTSTPTPTSTTPTSTGSGTPTSTPSVPTAPTTPTSTPTITLTPPTPPAPPALPTSTKQKDGFVFIVVDVLNGYGGTATPANFTEKITGTGASPSTFAGSANGTLVDMKPQAYALSQSKTVAGYSTTFSSGCTGTTVADTVVTCQVVETQLKPPYLVVFENVINSSFGTSTAANFAVAVKGTTVSPAAFAASANGTAVSLGAGTYSVSEKAINGYTITLSSGCSGTAAYGGSYVCTITAQDPAQSHLIVNENVVNGAGGTKIASNFSIKVTGTTVAPASFTGNANGTLVTMKPGAYSVAQTAVTGYSTVLSPSCSGTATAGQTNICTITTTQLTPPALTVIQNVVNTSFGTSTASSFTVAVKGTSVVPASFAGNASGTHVSLAPGAFSVTEKSINGYTITLGSGCTGAAAYSGSYTCVITAQDPAQSRLIVSENVTNGFGGMKTPANFAIKVTGTSVTPASFTGNASGTAVTLKPGAYSVSQTAVAGYSVAVSPACSGTAAPGQTIVCVISTIQLPPPTLTVVENVVNSYFGTSTASNFTVAAKGVSLSPTSFAGNASGTAVNLAPGAYSVTEKAINSYTVTLGSGCSGTAAYGGVYTCVITVSDPPISKLRVVENVLNNFSGTKIASNFTIKVTGTSVVPSSFTGNANGTMVTLKPGSYSIAQTAVKGYSVGYTPGCSGNVVAGETIECDVVSQDLPNPTLTVYQNVVNNYGGTATAASFIITAKATSVSSSSFVGNFAGTTIGFAPGAYSVTEKTITGYTVALSGCSGTGTYSTNYICTITATQTKPKGYVPPPVTPPVVPPVIPPVTPTSTPSVPTSTTPTSTTPTTPTSTPSIPTSTIPVTPTSTTPTSTPSVPVSGGGTVVGGPSTGSTTPVPAGTDPINITIGSGGVVVTSPNVTINVAGSGVAAGGSIQTSNEGGQGQTGWVPITPSYPWTLTPGQGVKTVTVNYMPPGSTLGATTSRSVFLYLGQDILSQPALDCDSADYLTGYAFAKNPFIADPIQVIKIQQFLNKFMGDSLSVTGIYDAATQAAIVQFQLQYGQEILQPWVPYGLPNSTTPTANTYKTTQRWINILACPGISIPLPNLP